MGAAPPPSHYQLERYALGELSESEAAALRVRLRQEPAAAARLAEIETPLVLRPLPPLGPSPVAAGRTARLRRVAAGGGLLAVAAAVALVVWGTSGRGGDGIPPARRLIKGGEVAVLVVGQRGGVGTSRFSVGESLKLQVSCPPGQADALRAVIYQDGVAHAPLPPLRGAHCGNGVAWPGAFSLDRATPVVACISWGVADPATTSAPGQLGTTAVCQALRARQ